MSPQVMSSYWIIRRIASGRRETVRRVVPEGSKIALDAVGLMVALIDLAIVAAWMEFRL